MKGFKKLSLFLVAALLLIALFSSFVVADVIGKAKAGNALWKSTGSIGAGFQKTIAHNALSRETVSPAGKGDNEKSNSEKITILSTADVHGRIYAYEYATDSVDENAGYAKLQTLIKQEKAKASNALLIDCGDTVQDNSAELFNDLPVHPMVQAMNRMGFDTWTLGNHEFNFEKAFLDRNIAAFKNSVLAANIYKTDGRRYVKPYKIFVVNGVRIAVVGLLPPHIPRWEASTPEHFQGLVFTDPLEEAKKVIKELEGRYDVLVGAFHLGPEGEYGSAGAIDIANACPEFNVIFCGHAHSRFSDIVTNGVKLIEPGAYGWALAKAEMNVEKTQDGYKVTHVSVENLQTEKVKEDHEILEDFDFVHKKSLEDANRVVGKITANYVDRVDYITGAARVTTMPTTQIEDTALIDLINEVQLYYAGAQVGGAAAFKNDMNLLAGDFKKKDVANIYKYTNTLIGVNITGANLKKYMEWSASYYNKSKPGDVTISFNPKVRGYNYDMFSGVTYDIDISKSEGQRIVNLKLKGKPIADNQQIKLAINNYRFGTLEGLKLITKDNIYYDSYAKMQDSGRIRDLIIKYIKEVKRGAATPDCDHNWKIIGFDFNNPLRDTVFKMIRNGEIKIPTSEDGRTPNVKAVNVNDLVQQGKLKTVQVLSFNDFHGSLAEDVSQTGKNVGMAKLVTAVKDAVAANPNTIVVSGGDNYQGTAISNLTYGLPVSEMMKSMNVVASAVGNHEFDWGASRIKTWAKDGNFPFLAANIYNRKTKKPVDWAKPYLIVKKGGIKVAFIGLAHPDTPSLTKMENTAGLEFRDPAVIAQQWINFLKAGKAREGKPDVIFALTHLDSAQDSQTGEITGNVVNLCNKVKGLDGVISAHSHLMVCGTVNKIPVVQAYYNGRAIATLAIVLDDKGKVKTVAPSVNSIYTSKSNIIPDQNSARDYAQFEKKLGPILGQKIGVATGEFAHDRSVKGTVTPFGKWVCDVMRKKTGAQIAIQNGGGLRTSLKAGDITVGDMYEIMPFDNYLVTLELSGAELKKAINHGINNPSITDGQFAGLKVTYDPKAKFGEQVVSINLENGAPIMDNKYYRVAINDFMLTGGDKYDFSKARNIKNTYIPVRDALIEAVKKAKTLSPPQIDYIKPLTMNVLYFNKYKLAV